MKSTPFSKFCREAQFESAFQIAIIFFALIWSPKDDFKTWVAIASLSCSFMTIAKASIENFLTFGRENKMTNATFCEQLTMIAKISPVFVLTTFFRAGCLCSTTIAAGIGKDGFGVNSGFYAAAFSVPLVLATPLIVLMLFKWFLSGVTLADLTQGVLGETFSITIFGKAGREGSRILQLATTIFHLVLHTTTTIFVLARMPSNRIWSFFSYFAFSSLTCGWIAFAIFVLQIFYMDKELNIASEAKRLVCIK